MKKDIYVIRNTVNDKCYVGQSVDYLLRFRKHKEEAKRNNYKYKSALYNAMNKYGVENFYVELLESCVENYNEREIYWINKLNTIRPNGYNVADGGMWYPNLSGVEHHAAKITNQEDLDFVFSMLQDGDSTISEIASTIGVDYEIISAINRGETYCREGYHYPIKELVLPKQKLDRITFDLKYSAFSYDEIAQMYGISKQQVKAINYGQSWKREYLSYPLRRIIFGSKSNADDAAQIQKELISTSIPLVKIADKYHCSVGTVIRINNGETHKNEKLQYPLRRHGILSQNDVVKIQELLLHSNKSINQISKQFDVSDATVKRINNGSTIKYRDDRLLYPLRAM